ncbi:hypothetical protein [Deinococcus altitudinis]|uniref:hypothetical protein n=1 Tax=Deinococcus altitudinis TaxID=468914 RepID=UPI003891AEBE
MQPYSTITVQQLSDHLSALRQEAAQARLVSSRKPFTSGLIGRLLKHFRRPARPGASKPSVHTL